MKKTFICLCLTLVFIFSSPLLVSACWMAPESLEIVSGDGSKVFVFVPDGYGSDVAHAVVYEIINNERHLVYSVEDLSSFAYESNFHFSADMMHFARRFPPPGMPAFEVFSYGERTRVVMRSDFIEDYASGGEFTSIGPTYTVSWRIEDHPPQDTTIIISTGEDSAILFDLATATFNWEDILPAHYETPTEVSPAPIYQPQNSPASITETNAEIYLSPNTQAQNPPILILVVAGAAVAFIATGAYLLIKRKRAE